MKCRLFFRSVHHFSSFVCLYVFVIINTNPILSCDVNKTTRVVTCKDQGNLAEQFRQLSAGLSDDWKLLNRVDIKYPIVTIPSNVFHDLSFYNIMIYNSTNLERIHNNCFQSTRKVTKRFVFSQTFVSKLVNDPPVYDLYKAISSLVNLEQVFINLGSHMIHEVPDRALQRTAFEQQKNLKFVEWYGYFTISRIGSDVFTDLPNVEQIVFKFVHVQQIDKNAFRMPKNDHAKRMNITFLNTSLTEKSFEPGVFANMGRPVLLNLGM